MAHEIMIEENGTASMFYVGEVPWHKQGTRLREPPATAAEAVKAAGLDWEVQLVPLYVSGVGRLIEVPNRRAVIRSDHIDRADCPIFAVVGSDYRLLQNREAFAFFDPLISAKQAHYETAGALRRGERVWVLAKLALDLVVGPDSLQPYVLLSNSHDGTGSVTVKLTAVRVVCQNTLTAALRTPGRAWQVRHNQSMTERLERSADALMEIVEGYKELAFLLNQFRTVPVSTDAAQQYVREVFPTPKSAPQPSIQEAVLQRHRNWAMHFFQHGRGNEAVGVQGTLWAAYNGVTEYIDHRKSNRLASDHNDARFQYSMFGSGAAVKKRALSAAARRLPSPPQLRYVDL